MKHGHSKHKSVVGSPLCPVDLFELYISKLNPEFKWFWQRPKRGKLHYNDKLWYDRMRQGHGPLENFMANLSKEAQLSKRYTNHSLRSTAMGILGEHFEGRHVIGLSGHKSENTIKQYVRKVPVKKKREMSDKLYENIQPPKQAKENEKKFTFKRPSTSETISKPPQEPENPTHPQPLQNEFQIQALDDAPPDDVLLNFLSQFDPVSENPPPNPVPLAANNVNNINNVNNVQNNVNPNQQIVPNMYFEGNSTVTINYHFGPK